MQILMSALLVFTIVHKTNNVLTGLEIMSVNVLVAMSWWMELAKVTLCDIAASDLVMKLFNNSRKLF